MSGVRKNCSRLCYWITTKLIVFVECFARRQNQLFHWKFKLAVHAFDDLHLKRLRGRGKFTCLTIVSACQTWCLETAWNNWKLASQRPLLIRSQQSSVTATELSKPSCSNKERQSWLENHRNVTTVFLNLSRSLNFVNAIRLQRNSSKLSSALLTVHIIQAVAQSNLYHALDQEIRFLCAVTWLRPICQFFAWKHSENSRVLRLQGQFQRQLHRRMDC